MSKKSKKWPVIMRDLREKIYFFRGWGDEKSSFRGWGWGVKRARSGDKRVKKSLKKKTLIIGRESQKSGRK